MPSILLKGKQYGQLSTIGKRSKSVQRIRAQKFTIVNKKNTIIRKRTSNTDKSKAQHFTCQWGKQLDKTAHLIAESCLAITSQIYEYKTVVTTTQQLFPLQCCYRLSLKGKLDVMSIWAGQDVVSVMPNLCPKAILLEIADVTVQIETDDS